MSDEHEFVLNTNTNEIHHLPFVTGSCNLNESESAETYRSLGEARASGGDLCGHCFKSRENS